MLPVSSPHAPLLGVELPHSMVARFQDLVLQETAAVVLKFELGGTETLSLEVRGVKNLQPSLIYHGPDWTAYLCLYKLFAFLLFGIS